MKLYLTYLLISQFDWGISVPLSTQHNLGSILLIKNRGYLQTLEIE